MAASAKRMLVRTATGNQTIALTAEQEEELRLTGDGRSKVDRIMDRNPGLFLTGGYGGFSAPPPGDETDAEVARLAADYPSAFDGPGAGPMTFRNLPEVHEVSRDDTEDDKRSTEEIARLLNDYPDLLSKESPSGANRRGRLAGPYPGSGPSGKPQTARR
jgi:hypothetical protein